MRGSKITAFLTAFLAVAGSVSAKDLFPDNWGTQELQWDVASHTVLLPKKPWNVLSWRDSGGTRAIEFENFIIRVAKDSGDPRQRPRVEASFFPQADFSDTAPCAGGPEVIVQLFSVSGNLISPPIVINAAVYKHQDGPLMTFASSPIQYYDIDKIGSIALSSVKIQADCGD